MKGKTFHFNIRKEDYGFKIAFESKFERVDKTCKGMVLHYMSKSLLDIYISFNLAKDIWDALERKYGNDDAGTKGYCVSKWLNFQVEEDKSIIDQIHE